MFSPRRLPRGDDGAVDIHDQRAAKGGGIISEPVYCRLDL